MAEHIAGEATPDDGAFVVIKNARICMFLLSFKNNYSQMKLDGPKSHGKVFEDDGDRVWIWDEVEETLYEI